MDRFDKWSILFLVFSISYITIIVIKGVIKHG